MHFSKHAQRILNTVLGAHSVENVRSLRGKKRYVRKKSRGVTGGLYCSVGDPDPKDQHHFAGSGSIIFSTDPDRIRIQIHI